MKLLAAILLKAKSSIFLLLAVFGLAACDPSFNTGPSTLGAGKSVSVALLVPYGSETPGDAAIAQSLENAARLAIADLGGENVALRVYNTGGNPETAAAAATLAADDGADIILGPLRSDAANAAALAVRGENINVLSFSNNASIAGGNLMIMGTTFETIATRVLSFAAAQGRGNVAVLYAQNTVGEIAKSSVVNAAARTGASIAAELPYEFSQIELINALPSISASIKSSGATSLMLTSDSTGALPLLGQLLPENGIDPKAIKYLGITRWDIPADTLSVVGLQGGWFALPDPTSVAAFEARYAGSYGQPPHPLAALAYDGVAAIGALAAEGRAPNSANLQQASGFAGANGVFRISSNGTAERALAIAEVKDAQVTILDPAPRSFGAGF